MAVFGDRQRPLRAPPPCVNTGFIRAAEGALWATGLFGSASEAPAGSHPPSGRAAQWASPASGASPPATATTLTRLCDLGRLLPCSGPQWPSLQTREHLHPNPRVAENENELIDRMGHSEGCIAHNQLSRCSELRLGIHTVPQTPLRAGNKIAGEVKGPGAHGRV